MSAQTKVEVTRGVFDPRTYKQVKVLRKELREREQKAMASILSRAEVKTEEPALSV